MSLPDPEKLLLLAESLISSGGPEPGQENLRRAISSAYYAVFHAVLTDVADNFQGRDARQSPNYSLLCRSVDHRRARQLCDDLKKDKLPEKYQKYLPAGGLGPELTQFSEQFGVLQDLRTSADYDPQFHINGSDTTLAVDIGRTAIRNFASATHEQRAAFASLLLFPPR